MRTRAPYAPATQNAGSALIVLLILSLLLVGFASAFLSRGVRETKAGAGYHALSRAHLAAESLLVKARVILRSGEVDGRGRNKLLKEVLESGTKRLDPGGSTLKNELSGAEYRLLLDDETGRVWASRLLGDYVRLEAEATVGQESSFLITTLLERVPVSFAQRFVGGLGVYPGVSALTEGPSPFRDGDVLIVDPLPTEIQGEKAKSKKDKLPEIVDVTGPELQDLGTGELLMPDDRIFEDLEDQAGEAYVFKKKKGYLVTFAGNRVLVEEFHPKGKGKAYDLVLPPNGILYIDDEVLSLSGDVNGRVTLVAERNVNVTGNLRYVDSEGDPRMLGGGEPGSTYSPNPDYGGDSVLGVVARGSIYYSPAMPSDAELNAAFFSLTGTVGLEMLWYDSGVGLNRSGFGAPLYYYDYTAQGKRSLKELGSKTSSGLPSTGVQDTALGFAETVSLYDPQLLTRAPPWFPRFAGIEMVNARRVGRIVALNVGEKRGRTRKYAGKMELEMNQAYVESVRAAARETYRDFGVKVE